MGRGQRKGVELNGWLVIHKPTGISSAHAVAVVKRLTRAAKVGHGGTLDPFSEGVLPMALGRATKRIASVLGGDKAYHCWIRFGWETDSGDPTGQVTEQTEIVPERAALEAILPQFTGQQQQIPPAYSAIHVGGVRAYELARRGEPVVLEPRTVQIHSVRLEAYQEGLAELSVWCGKGTYMRSLARDLGRRLGSLAHLQGLLRTATLGFSLQDAITLEQLSAAVGEGRLEELLLPVDRVLDDIPASRPRSMG
ncbi:MAG: tRNA pseudouridine(55) synthase TruB [Magnetococcus sp. MYC-9]